MNKNDRKIIKGTIAELKKQEKAIRELSTDAYIEIVEWMGGLTGLIIALDLSLEESEEDPAKKIN